MAAFVAFILLLRVRIVFLAFFLVIPLQLVLSIKTKKYRKRLGLAILGMFLLLFVGSLANKSIRSYTLAPALQILKMQTPAEGGTSNKDFRIDINLCNFELIKSHWLLGVGWGDANDRLRECFEDKNLTELSRGKYNAHNQYAYLWTSSGLFCLLFFLLMIGYNAQRAIASGNVVYISFLLLILLMMLTENILSRIYGVTFFAFFNALLHSYTFDDRIDRSEK